MTDNNSLIPKQIIQPVINTTWDTDDFNLNQFEHYLEYHNNSDKKSKLTSKYIFRRDANSHSIRGEEFFDMKPYIDQHFINNKGNAINQHYIHSLQQMYSEMQKSYNQHIERTNALIGTDSGRIS